MIITVKMFPVLTHKQFLAFGKTCVTLQCHVCCLDWEAEVQAFFIIVRGSATAGSRDVPRQTVPVRPAESQEPGKTLMNPLGRPSKSRGVGGMGSQIWPDDIGLIGRVIN